MLTTVQQFINSRVPAEYSDFISPGTSLCVIDSSFNPPNRAHVKLALICAKTFPGSTLVLMLGTSNADKTSVPVHELQRRLEMMQCVARSAELKGLRVVIALTAMPRFTDKCYLINRDIQPARLVFAMGFDTAVRFADPKYYVAEGIEGVMETFFAKAELLVLTRNNGSGQAFDADDQAKSLSKYFYEHHLPRITTISSDDETEGVSSTETRLLVKELRRQAPIEVLKYIFENEMYMDK